MLFSGRIYLVDDRIPKIRAAGALFGAMAERLLSIASTLESGDVEGVAGPVKELIQLGVAGVQLQGSLAGADVPNAEDAWRAFGAAAGWFSVPVLDDQLAALLASVKMRHDGEADDAFLLHTAARYARTQCGFCFFSVSCDDPTCDAEAHTHKECADADEAMRAEAAGRMAVGSS